MVGTGRLHEYTTATDERIVNAEARRPRLGGWMQTFTGLQVWPLDMRPEDIVIEDIAHALSMLCRYAGHCENFYSVAEHSVLVAAHMPTRELRMWGLLHDASEAYLVDVPRPIKPHLPGYKTAEQAVMRAVAERFDLLPRIEPAEVKAADNAILLDEQRQNLKAPPAPWSVEGEPLGVRLHCWPPHIAERKFLTAFDRILEGDTLDEYRTPNA